MEELHKQGMLYCIRGLGDRNLRYIACEILTEELKTTMPHDPDDCEHIAKGLAIVNPDKITTMDLLIYGQILSVLRQRESRMPDDPLIKEWATKVRITYENPETVDHITNMSNSQIQKETNKIEGVEKESKVEKAHDIDIRKRQQEKELMGLEEELSLFKNAK